MCQTAGAILYLTPKEKPIVTIYMHSDCGSCRSWMRYLKSRGFRTQIGEESDWPTIRTRFKLPPAFRGRHTAVVNGLFLEGHVPARDIYAVLAKSASSECLASVVHPPSRSASGTGAS